MTVSRSVPRAMSVASSCCAIPVRWDFTKSAASRHWHACHEASGPVTNVRSRTREHHDAPPDRCIGYDACSQIC
jgi:hypothetical protein